MRKNTLIYLFLFLISFNLSADSNYSYKFLVEFKHKHQSNFSLDKPEDYLSSRSIERRQAQNIAIDSTDLPVNSVYIQTILDLGVSYVTKSKWLNTLTIQTSNINFPTQVESLPFVKSTELTWRNDLAQNGASPQSINKQKTLTEDVDFLKQLKVHQLEKLHALGYKGNGMLIGVLDAGFENANILSSLSNMYNNNQIIDTADMVNPVSNLYKAHYHGAMVLTCMAAYAPNNLVGTAPEADYLLIRTEDVFTEFPIEMDYWIAGAEYADSMGVDLMNTSLGYSEFDDTTMNFSYSDLDGKTARISIGANIAAQKGIVVVNSAGNSGLSPWKHITPPADAEDVLTVGSINRDSSYTVFSSIGPTADGRTKPDVMAIGGQTSVQGALGNFGTGSGTSFSSPLMCGAVACLWQAFPNLNAKEVVDIVKKSSHKFNASDNFFGYGIPDLFSAYQEYLLATKQQYIQPNTDFAYPNPAQNTLNIRSESENYILRIYSTNGTLLKQIKVSSVGSSIHSIDLSNVPRTLLIIEYESETEKRFQKLLRY